MISWINSSNCLFWSVLHVVKVGFPSVLYKDQLSLKKIENMNVIPLSQFLDDGIELYDVYHWADQSFF